MTAETVTLQSTPRTGRITRLSASTMWLINVAIAGAMVLIPMPRITLGLLTLCLIMSLLLVGVPIAIGMLLGSALGLLKISGLPALEATLEETVYNSAANWSLSVIPGFILMGSLLSRAGLTDRVFEAARQWLGKVPGGMAVGTNFSGAGLAAVSGSTIGVTYALGRVALPAMLEAGYNKRLATGTVSVVGTLGQLIPPSILLVVYAGVAQTAVGPQLVASVMPAIILAAAYGLMIIIMCIARPSLAPKPDLSAVTMATRLKSIIGVIPVALIFVGVVGGMFAGIFTATEAAAFGALSSGVVAWLFNKEFRESPRRYFKQLGQALLEAVTASATIFLLLIGVYVLTRTITVSRLTVSLTDWILALDLGRVEFLLLLILVYIVLGLFLDPLAMILLTVPLLVQPLEYYEIDMIWFGVFVLILGEVAQVSPPVGLMTFIVHRIAQDPDVNRGHHISLGDVFKGALPFIAVTLGFLVLMIFVPEITTVLSIPD